MDRRDFVRHGGMVMLGGGSVLAANVHGHATAPVSGSVYNVRDYGAVGDGIAKDTAAIQAAVDACAKAGGGTVYVPPGNFLSGGIQLFSNIALLLDQGATILGSRDRSDYQSSGNSNRSYVVYAEEAENVSIVGQGIINGQASEDYGERWGVPEDADFRTRMVGLIECRNVLIRDVTIKYSDSWTVVLTRCENVKIDRINILNNVRRLNSDAIDPVGCRNVHISNCHIESGDDSICPKTEAGADYPCENFVVTNCTLITTTTGIKLGTGSQADFRNMHFSNITIFAPTGIGLYMKDGGTAERITFSNITIKTPPRTYRTVTPIFLDIEKRTPESRISYIRDVSFRDIVIESGSSALVQSIPESTIENVSFENVTFRVDEPDAFEGRSKPKGGTSQRTVMDVELAQLPTYMAISNVDGLRMKNVRFFLSERATQLFDRSAIFARNVRNLRLSDIDMQTPGQRGKAPTVELHDADRVFVTDCMPEESTPLFLSLNGSGSKSVALIGNDFSGIQKPYVIGNGARPKIVER